jgi:hypothetical protein
VYPWWATGGGGGYSTTGGGSTTSDGGIGWGGSSRLGAPTGTASATATRAVAVPAAVRRAPLEALGPAPHAGPCAGEAGTDPHAPATSTGAPAGEAAAAVGRGWGATRWRAHALRWERLLRRRCAYQGRRAAHRRGEGRWRGREVSARQPWEERRAARRLPSLWRGAAAVALRPLERCAHVGAARWRGATAALHACWSGGSMRLRERSGGGGSPCLGGDDVCRVG